MDRVGILRLPGAPAMALVVALAAQVVLWHAGRDIMPERPIVPPVPARASVEALALGDGQVAYRAMGLALQNFGDTGGRRSALADYDYTRLIGWLDLLIALEPKAWYAPALAAVYYAHTPQSEDARRVIEFLVAFAHRDPPSRWRLLAHAVHLARHNVRDLPYALEIARGLAAIQAADMPFWPRQLPALILADLGRVEEAAREIRALGARYPDMPPEEARYQDYFLEHRLGLAPESRPAHDPSATR